MRVLFARVRKKTPAEKRSAERMTLREFFSGRRRHEIKGILWWTFSLLWLGALWPHTADHNALGPTGEVLFRVGFALLGILVYAAPAAAAWIGWRVFRDQTAEQALARALGISCAALALGILVQLLHPEPVAFDRVRLFYAWRGAEQFWQSWPAWLRLWDAGAIPAGGYVADFSQRFLVTVFSTWGAYILSAALLVVAVYLLEAEAYVLGALRHARERLSIWSRGWSRSGEIRRAALAPQPAKARAAVSASLPPTAAPVTEPTKIKIHTPPPAAPAPASVHPRPRPAATTPASQDTPEATEDQAKVFHLPGLDLLESPPADAAISVEYFEGMSKTLENALAQFGVAAKVVEVCPGPVVTRYELQPSPGVKVNRIISLADDIALAMKAEHVRIEAPIPGKGAVGIEIPNREKQIVVLKELLGQPEFASLPSPLSFAVGKDIGGKHILARLDTMPHLLIAGATGSGKSACINAIVCSLLYRATPREVRFLMIDPKRVELTMYNGVPHLKSPVITDNREAAVALKLMVREMEERYKLFAEQGVRDIAGFNARVEAVRAERAGTDDAAVGTPAPPASMPYIVVFIDELADLMLVAANEVENAITRLAQMARGVGIHMVLATQRPSVDVITGVIKANFPSRIAFQVSSKVDSRTILDANGADALLGRGDMLYAPASASKPLRVQGVFVTTAEVERVARFWKEQGEPVFDAAFSSTRLKTEGSGVEGGGEEDDLFEEAVGWVVRAKQASTSMLQRRLKVGYSRAARLLDLMEEKGIVGPPEGSKPRKVLVSPGGPGLSAGLEEDA